MSQTPRRPYRIAWSPRAQRELAELPEKVATAAIEFAYGAPAENPKRGGRPLRLELEGFHAARRGDHRILYQIDDQERVVLVHTVEHRSDVYRRR